MSHFDIGTAPRCFRSSALRSEGRSWREIARAVARGDLLRLRRGVYASADIDARCATAGRLQGRLDCVSELRRRGVFVRDSGPLHVHVPESASRLPAAVAAVRVHRRELRRTPHPDALAVEPLDALRQAVLCQDARPAIATIDSALHHGVIRGDELDELFAALPRRLRRLRALIDARAESGPETFVRLMLRALGRSVDLQVAIHGVGRVDLLVDGWLIVECDSRAHHSDPATRRRDRLRDLEAARQGYVTLRLDAEDILWRSEVVIDALKALTLRPRR